MLSERERQALDDIERRLTYDDPDLAARLRNGSMPTMAQRLRHALAVVLVTAAMVSALAGQWGVAAACVGTGIGWVVGRTLRRRRRRLSRA